MDDDISGKHIMVNIRMNKIRTVTTIVAVKMIRNVMIVYLRLCIEVKCFCFKCMSSNFCVK